MNTRIHPCSGILLLALLVAIAFVMPVKADNNAAPRQQTAQDKSGNKPGAQPRDLPKDLIEKDSELMPLPIKKGKFMFSVTLHKREEIDSLLTRADNLSKTMRSKGNKSAIALILHGPEIKLFTRKNFKKNQDIIDKAARLDEENVIQVKVCKTKMKELGIKNEDLPSFMEIIPYAPEEEKRLLDQGYVYL
jgi:intracellular sulfur oxidation DsrE/DsrF family protein